MLELSDIQLLFFDRSGEPSLGTTAARLQCAWGRVWPSDRLAHFGLSIIPGKFGTGRYTSAPLFISPMSSSNLSPFFDTVGVRPSGVNKNCDETELSKLMAISAPASIIRCANFFSGQPSRPGPGCSTMIINVVPSAVGPIPVRADFLAV